LVHPSISSLGSFRYVSSKASDRAIFCERRPALGIVSRRVQLS
jgi:hypothetical protein